MGRYIIRRMLQAIPLLFFISVLLFILMNSLGDPLSIFADSRRPLSGKQREELTRRLGLDQPVFPNQYVTWLVGNDWHDVDVRGDGTLMAPGTRKGVLRGDFGMSFVTRQPATSRIAERLPQTLQMQIPAFLLTIALSILVGTYSAIRQYSFLDNVITTICFFLYSLPIFFIALMMIYIFGLQFKLMGLPSLPIQGTGDGTFPDLIAHMIMPVFCLVAIQAAGYIRFVRASMLEAIGQDYVRTARSKGLGEGSVMSRHVFKNASLPLVTLIGLDLPTLLAGAVVTESIFGWPGMGRLFVESLDRSDYNVMMAILMLLTIAIVIFQLLTDIVYTWLDPRIRYA
jgi:peptide/nickel transport system permease protein